MIIRDVYGFIGQPRTPQEIKKYGIKVEGGDSVNYEGHYYYLTGLMSWMNEYEVGFGSYVRHPVARFTDKGFGAFYKNPWTGVISRDQLLGIIAGRIQEGDIKAMVRIILHHACSLFLFAYNSHPNGEDPEEAKRKLPDLTGPDVWSMELRGLGWASWIFWPLLCIFDLHMLINTIVINKTTDNECISYLIRLFVSREYVPTPISWLSLRLLEQSYIKFKLHNYWGGWRKQPDFIPLYLNKLKELTESN